MSLFGQNSTSGLNTGTAQNVNTNNNTLGSSSLGGSSTTAQNPVGNNLTNNMNNTLGSSARTSTTLPTTLGTSNTSKLLKSLLESAHNLPKSDNHELGSIHLTLGELQRKSQQLRKLDDSKDLNFTKAHYLLASSGISAEEIQNELNSIDLPPPQSDPSISTTSPVGTVDSSAVARLGSSSLQYNHLENYLNSKKDENILNSIEQSLNLASRDFDNYISSKISIDWKVRRDELRKSIGLGNSSGHSEASVKNSLTWNKSIPGSYNILSLSENKSSGKLANKISSLKQVTRDKFENHAKIIYQLNEARLENNNYPLGLNFAELNKLQSDLKSKQICESWKILIDLTNEKFSKTNQEQKFYESYQNTASNSSSSKALNKNIVNNSKSYLESEFFHYLEEIYLKENNKSPEFLPATNLNKISYFIHNIVLKNDSELLNQTLSVNGTPIWALVFYLIRAGLYNDALDLTLKNKDIFNKFDTNFPTYLKKFVEDENHTLPSALNERLHTEFNHQFQFILSDNANANERLDFDPYKYSVYKIIGKCDLGRKSLPNSINFSIEDWLWFHFSIINETQYNESNLIFENYGLHNLQHKIVSLGPKSFNTSSNNPLYLKTLVMVGLYELAVQYAYEHINECDAVHLAIGLQYYGLLKVSSTADNEDLLIVRDNEYEINFSRLIGSYTRTFKISDPKVACQYLILIAMTRGSNCRMEVAICHEALRELILISREFSLLLGELNQLNGNKIPGILERQRSLIKLLNLDEFHHQITEISAVKCEEEGRIFDALLLYQLCQEYDTVVSLLNKLLAEILASTELDKPIIKFGKYETLAGDEFSDSSDTIDNNIILLAQHLMKVFNNNTNILEKIAPQKKETCDLFLPIINIRDLFIRKDFSQVIFEIRKLGLIPIGEDDDLLKIRKLSELLQSNHLDDSLIKVIPSLLIMAMTSISQLNYDILTKRYQALGNEREELARLKKLSKNCMIYAGMVQYKMPRETYSLLISLESLL